MVKLKTHGFYPWDMGNTWDLPSFGPCFLFCLGTFSLSSWFSRKDEFVLHSEKQGALCHNIESGNVWGVLKMRDPQVTIVFNTAWMIWVTHHNFRNLRMKFHDIWSYMFHVRNMCQHWGLIFWIYVGKYIPYMEHMEHNGAYEQNVFTKKRARSEYDSWLIASREPKKKWWETTQICQYSEPSHRCTARFTSVFFKALETHVRVF